MDNFVDKMSQRINAQEMIKANAQAEANEMQRLQEQVAQYEAILQDMRKLNYKNSELTDKINTLVDESMQKVQSAKGSAAGAEEANVSSDLSEAIMAAVEEAMRGLDVSSLNESVNNTLMIPVDEMKQSSLMVSDSVSEVRQIAQDVRTSVDEVRNSSEELKTSVKASVDNAILTMRRENREIAEHLEYIRSTVDNIKTPSEEDEALREEMEAKRKEEEKAKEEARLAKEEEDKKALEERFKQSDDFVHKENVKVYRNVQAVVVDEFKNQTEGLTKHNHELYERVNSVRVAVIIAIALGFANLILMVLKILNIL